MDVLSEAINTMRTGRPHSSRQRLRAPWRLHTTPFTGAGFHVVLQGSPQLIADGVEPVLLSMGDVVFLPHGTGHELVDAAAERPPAAPVELRLEHSGQRPDEKHSTRNDMGTSTALLCGAYLLNQARPHPLLAELPAVIHLPARVGSHPSLRGAIELLGTEMEKPDLGEDIIVPAFHVSHLVADDEGRSATAPIRRTGADDRPANRLHLRIRLRQGIQTRIRRGPGNLSPW